MASLRREGAAAIVELEGRLVFGEPVVEFRSRWSDALAGGAQVLIIDMANVPYIDSSGIGSLVRCLTAARKNGATVMLVGTPAAVRSALKTARLDTLFVLRDTQAEALALAVAAN